MRRRLLVAAALWCLCSGLPYWSLPGLWGDEALPPAQAPPRLAALDIETAVELALGASDELRHARIERDIAAERTRLSLRSFFPAVTLGYAQNDSVVYGAADSRLKRLSVGLSQVLFARGSRVSRYRLSNLELGVQARALAQARAALMLLDVPDQSVGIGIDARPAWQAARAAARKAVTLGPDLPLAKEALARANRGEQPAGVTPP